MTATSAAAWSEVFKEIATVKPYCSEMVGHVVDRTVQVFGGIGYTRGRTVERLRSWLA